MKRNNKNINKEDFQRYLENKMTNAERNAFERELQKHPFETEALEGFQQILPVDLKEDLNELSGKIILAKKKNNTRYWAAAATLLLLISTGIIWFQLKDKSPVPEITELKTSQIEEDKIPQTKTQKQEFNELIIEEDNIASFQIIDESVAKKMVSKPFPLPEKEEEVRIKIPTEEEIQSIQIDQIQKNNEMMVTDTKKSEPKKSEIRIRGYSASQKSAMPGVSLTVNKTVAGADTTKVIKGKIISLDDSLPLTGVTIFEKGTNNGTISNINGNFTLQLINKSDSVLIANFIGMEETEFYPSGDSILLVGMNPSQLALDEVVTIAYGVNTVIQTDESLKYAQPKDGMVKFKKYLNEYAILPENYTEKKVVVKVNLRINIKGEITSVENKNDTDTTVFDLAKQILQNGPVWKPETINETPVESEVILRIVFKKEE